MAHLEQLQAQIDSVLRERDKLPESPEDMWEVLLGDERFEIAAFIEEEPAMLAADPATLTISASGHMVVDPQTMLPFRETLNRTLNMDVPTTTITQRMTVSELRTVRYSH